MPKHYRRNKQNFARSGTLSPDEDFKSLNLKSDEDEKADVLDRHPFHYTTTGSKEAKVDLTKSSCDILTVEIDNICLTLHKPVAVSDALPSFQLHCKPKLSSRHWSVEVDYNLDLSYSTFDLKTLHKNGTIQFDQFTEQITIQCEKLKNLLDQINIKLSVNVTTSFGIMKSPVSYFGSSPLTDAVLLVEGEKLHVSKAFLATHSSYFYSMFYKGFSEQESSTVTLHDMKSSEVKDFLRVLYPERLAVTVESVEYLMRLADFFDCPVVLRDCAEFLSKTTTISVEKKLFLGDKNNAPQVLSHCFDLLQNMGSSNLAALATTTEIRQCSDRLQAYLFHLLSSFVQKPLKYPKGLSMDEYITVMYE